MDRVSVGLSIGEPGQDLSRSGPLNRVFGQALRHQGPEIAGNASEIRVSMDHPVEQCGGRSGPEGAYASGGEHQHRAQAEYVRGRAHLMALGLLGRHEPG